MTVTAETETFNPKVKDRVVLKPEYGRAQDIGVVYVVERVLPVNVVLRPENGGRGVKCPPYMLAPAPAAGQPVATGQFIPYQPPLDNGQVVKLKGKEGLFVVTGERNDKYSVFPLGGSTRYYRAARALLTPVKVTKIETEDA